MSNEVRVWFHAKCSKCRSVRAILEEAGVAAEYFEYLEREPTREEVTGVLAALGESDPRRMMRSKDELYRTLSLDERTPEEALEVLLAHPSLIERPIVHRGEQAIIARPPELIHEFLAST